jgi:nitroreductase
VDLNEAMRTTPATREFTSDDVGDDVVYDILEHARFAPNGGNRQAWKVIVIRDQATKDRLGRLYHLGGREYIAHSMAGLVPFVASASGPTSEPAVDIAAAAADESLAIGMFDRIAEAPVLLLICLDLDRVSAVDTGLGRPPISVAGSVYPFAHNILLAARARGLGGTITTLLVRREREVKALLGIPERDVIATLVPLGRPAKVITKLRRDPVESFTTRERYDGEPFGK